ncbi:MAG: GyrI-like domain-containing protein [Firmicutes bacterium]|nr:GyrI-like domain-containing protein [Bacillota bacterium]
MKRILLPFYGLGCAALMATGPEPSPRLLESYSSFHGPMVVQTYAEGTFFHVKATTTLVELPRTMAQQVPILLNGLTTGRIGTLGPLCIVYHGLESDPAKPFEMEIGVMVPKDTQAVGVCQVRRLPAFTCASTVFTGSFTEVEVGKAYKALFPALIAEGKKPSGELRQMIFLWEGGSSRNNTMLVQIGLQSVN